MSHHANPGSKMPPEGSDAWSAALVDQARSGHEAAFEALVRIHQDRLYQVALRMTGRAEDAQDVVQEALLQAWTRLPAFRGDAAFGTWLTRIVINRCHNLRRDTRPTSPLPERGLDPATPALDDVVVTAQHRDATMKAVLELPHGLRAALVLHTFNGCSHAEVARVLGISESAAKVRVHRARRALIDQLLEWR